mgnify:CR=1 FL=1
MMTEDQIKEGCEYMRKYFKVVHDQIKGYQIVEYIFKDMKGRMIPVEHRFHSKSAAADLLSANQVDGKNLMEFYRTNGRRIFREMEFNPRSPTFNPLEYEFEQGDVLNTFYGFNAEHLTQSGVKPNERGLEFMLDHLKALCGDNEEHFQYVLDVLSYPIQNPGEKSDIALVVKGTQGCGKTAFFKKFIANKTHGKPLSHEVHGGVGTFQAKLARKTFIIIDEVHNMKDKARDLLKAAITCDDKTFNEKHEKEYIENDHANFLCTCDKDPENLVERKNRRAFCVVASDRFEKNTEHFDRLHELIDDEGTAVAFYQYLKERPIRILEKGQPALMTPFKKRLMKQSIHPVFQYFQDLIETNDLPEKLTPGSNRSVEIYARRMPLKEFIKDLNAYCRDNMLRKADYVVNDITTVVDLKLGEFYSEVKSGNNKFVMFKRQAGFQPDTLKPHACIIFPPRSEVLCDWSEVLCDWLKRADLWQINPENNNNPENKDCKEQDTSDI